MGLLVGLPLKLFHLLFVVLRLAWPVCLILLIVWFVRRRRQTDTQHTSQPRTPKEPEFRGPVYTVDYEDVEE